MKTFQIKKTYVWCDVKGVDEDDAIENIYGFNPDRSFVTCVESRDPYDQDKREDDIDRFESLQNNGRPLR